MTSKTVTIKNRAGIHARPAALIVNTANQYESEIFLEKDTMRINSKSIMGIITLGASYKSSISIMAEGPDENDAVEAIAKLFENRFEEE
ncbi:MAG: HPr family phosphocarrier protein [Spirochaetaceae bacterium]|nr:HPr family phosphocarrier protein [Spirochaetaceae bacterium]MCF7949660.1 HPr family phosphocarrier protein [Spirochaetia bacterium]MCF7951815.1 HPr family phosphocarrier protein [Spirochaetaceae bacterium]HKK65322.1 HPr family phosphocarrier protein [Clostridia bacterium]